MLDRDTLSMRTYEDPNDEFLDTDIEIRIGNACIEISQILDTVSWLVQMNFNNISMQPSLLDLIPNNVPIKEIRELFRHIRKSLLATL